MIYQEGNIEVEGEETGQKLLFFWKTMKQMTSENIS